MAKAAKAHGTLISFDLNHRATFWKGREEELREAFHQIASVADVLVGNEKLMAQFHISAPDVDTDGTVVHLAADGVYQGYLIVSDEIKPTTADALKLLKSAGIRKTHSKAL